MCRLLMYIAHSMYLIFYLLLCPDLIKILSYSFYLIFSLFVYKFPSILDEHLSLLLPHDNWGELPFTHYLPIWANPYVVCPSIGKSELVHCFCMTTEFVHHADFLPLWKFSHPWRGWWFNVNFSPPCTCHILYIWPSQLWPYSDVIAMNSDIFSPRTYFWTSGHVLGFPLVILHFGYPLLY